MTFRFQLHAAALHLNGVGPIEHHDAAGDFWSDRTRPEFRTGHILSTFTYTQTWTYQERHPDGDELAIVLNGRVDLLTDHGHGETAEPLEAGHGAVIPAGAWHRLRINAPSTLLFITPTPSRTEHHDLSAQRPSVRSPFGVT
jgi:quercetin dioxygenase-like cupin family protein